MATCMESLLGVWIRQLHGHSSHGTARAHGNCTQLSHMHMHEQLPVQARRKAVNAAWVEVVAQAQHTLHRVHRNVPVRWWRGAMSETVHTVWH